MSVFILRLILIAAFAYGHSASAVGAVDCRKDLETTGLGNVTVPTIDPLFGPEFTFTNPEIIAAAQSPRDFDTAVANRFLWQWHSTIAARCEQRGDCRIQVVDRRHKSRTKFLFVVNYTDGWWYSVGLDPKVIEVQAKPGTLLTFQQNRERMELDIFGLADSLNLRPHHRIGGGHLNLDMATSFGEPPDPLLFRNFLVDQANHPELASGIFGENLYVAPPIAALGLREQEAFGKVITTFDSMPKNAGSVVFLVREINRTVYKTNFNFLDHPEGNHFINFTHIWSQSRLEVRSVRPQGTVEEWLLECEFFKGRLNFLRNFRDPIPLQLPESHRMSLGRRNGKFESMLLEMDLDPTRFQRFFMATKPDSRPLYFDWGNRLYTRDKLRPDGEGRLRSGAYFRTNLNRLVEKIQTSPNKAHIILAAQGQGTTTLLEDIALWRRETRQGIALTMNLQGSSVRRPLLIALKISLYVDLRVALGLNIDTEMMTLASKDEVSFSSFFKRLIDLNARNGDRPLLLVLNDVDAGSADATLQELLYQTNVDTVVSFRHGSAELRQVHFDGIPEFSLISESLVSVENYIARLIHNSSVSFTESAIDTLHGLSGGWPHDINKILLYLPRNRHTIDAQDILEVYNRNRQW